MHNYWLRKVENIRNITSAVWGETVGKLIEDGKGTEDTKCTK